MQPDRSQAERPGAQAPSVHVVPFSHLDLYWGGTREECLSRGNRIITRALQLAQRLPQFRFLLEDEVFVHNYLESHRGAPEVEVLRRLVREGQIELAPKWAAIYQNLPRGEAHVRNLLYGKRYARQEFGVDPQVVHLGDLPGYTQQYPQLLARSSVPYMVMTRMGPPDLSLFRWRSPDGSRVLAWHAYKGYQWGAELGLHRQMDDAMLARVGAEVAEIAATTRGPVFLAWGIDLWAPNETLVENAGILDKSLAPARFRLSTPSEFFNEASEARDVPEVTGEIPSSWANILTTMAPLWPQATTATDTLLDAEAFAAINWALGYADYPAEEFRTLWRKALESMDHNNFGQGGEIGDERKLGYARLVALRAGDILREAQRNIAERVENPFGRSTAIVVFNPSSWPRDDVIQAHATLYGDVSPADIADYKRAMRLVDETGVPIPFHVQEHSENISRALRLAFIARDVPSVGYKTYYLVPADEEASFEPACRVQLDSALDAEHPRRVVGAEVIENAHYHVAVDRATGRIDVFDKDLDRPVVSGAEICGTEERGGNSLNVEPQTGRTIVCIINQVALTESNAVRAVVRIDGDLAGIPIVQTVALYRDLKRVDVETTVDWRPGRFVKLEQVVPYAHPHASVRYGIPFGSAAADDLVPGCGPHFPDEVPTEVWRSWRQIQDWVFVGDSDWGVTLCADRQLISLADGAFRFGMLRGTRFNQLHIVRDGRPQGCQQPPAGVYTFRYTLTSGPGGWAQARPWQRGLELVHRLHAVQAADELSGKFLPAVASFCSIAPGGMVVTALKKAEDADVLVVRLCEMAGANAETSIEVLGEECAAQPANLLEEPLPDRPEAPPSLGPCEVATFLVSAGRQARG